MSEDETKCQFISTRGIIKSCDIFPVWNEYNQLCNVFNFSHNNRYGCIIYIHFDMVFDFILNHLDYMKNPFILVTGASDHSCPYDINQYEKLLDSEKVLKWYSQNIIMEHSKLIHIPIGIDYHTLSYGKSVRSWCNWTLINDGISPLCQELVLLGIKNKLKILKETKALCVSNFHHSMYGVPKRRENIRVPVYEKLKDNDNIIWLPEQTRDEFWRALDDIAFVICPFGNGVDTHRTWEILCLGRIPVIEKSILNNVFKDLPVLEVNNWCEIDNIFLENSLKNICLKLDKGEYDLDKLMLNYWINKIRYE